MKRGRGWRKGRVTTGSDDAIPGATGIAIRIAIQVAIQSDIESAIESVDRAVSAVHFSRGFAHGIDRVRNRH